MWLSRKQKEFREEAEGPAQIGEVTLGGANAAVFLSGERRNLTPVSPGGYHWKPKERDQVLVLKSGQGEAASLLGCAAAAPSWLGSGEIWISAGGESGILLTRQGEIHLRGPVFLNGRPLLLPGAEGEGE